MSILWYLIILVFVTIVTIFLGLVAKDRRSRKKLFNKILNSTPPVVKVDTGTSYSWRYYTIVFESETDLRQAEENGLCSQIQDDIKKYVGRKDFDPRAGIHFMTLAQFNKLKSH